MMRLKFLNLKVYNNLTINIVNRREALFNIIIYRGEIVWTHQISLYTHFKNKLLLKF